MDKRKLRPHPTSPYQGEGGYVASSLLDKEGLEGGMTLQDQKEISYEFQNAVNEVLSYKILEAAKQKSAKTILLAGGVSANDDLREKITLQADKEGVPFFYPTKKLYCMDNAAMIGILAYYRIKYEKFEKHIGTVEVGKW